MTGTGRSHSRSQVLELGADRFVALDEDRLEDAAGRADLVFDTIGGEVLARSPPSSDPGERWSPCARPRYRSSGYEADITFDGDGFVTLYQDYLERVG